MGTLGYIYDGSFEGLLTSIYEVYYRKENPDFILSSKSYNRKNDGTFFPMLEVPLRIITSKEKFEKVYNGIINKISPDSMETIYHAYLSEIENFEIMILNYIRFGFKTGFDTNKHIHQDIVNNMIKAEGRVLYETHRILGFLRFEAINGFLYSSYEPDYNITSLITPHFVERLPMENFIIHDIKREIASVYNKSIWYITHLDKDEIKKIVHGKSIYQDLWKEYFISATIAERENLKHQKRQMPKRYWKHLPEI